MRVESVKWFESYLVSRTQLVYVNNPVSNFDTVTCGVPQGNMLGPLLFLCYINDMKTSVSEDCKLMLYADDSAILFSHRDSGFIADRLGKELEMCSEWLVCNKLSLQLGKKNVLSSALKENSLNSRILKLYVMDTL